MHNQIGEPVVLLDFGTLPEMLRALNTVVPVPPMTLLAPLIVIVPAVALSEPLATRLPATVSELVVLTEPEIVR